MLFLVSLWGCYWKRIEFDSIGRRMVFPCFRWMPSNPLRDKIEKLKSKCGGRSDYLSWIWDFILSWPWTWELLVFRSLGPPGLHQPLLCKGLGLWVEVMPSCIPHFRLKCFIIAVSWTSSFNINFLDSIITWVCYHKSSPSIDTYMEYEIYTYICKMKYVTYIC